MMVDIITVTITVVHLAVVAFYLCYHHRHLLHHPTLFQNALYLAQLHLHTYENSCRGQDTGDGTIHASYRKTAASANTNNQHTNVADRSSDPADHTLRTYIHTIHDLTRPDIPLTKRDNNTKTHPQAVDFDLEVGAPEELYSSIRQVPSQISRAIQL